MKTVSAMNPTSLQGDSHVDRQSQWNVAGVNRDALREDGGGFLESWRCLTVSKGE